MTLLLPNRRILLLVLICLAIIPALVFLILTLSVNNPLKSSFDTKKVTSSLKTVIKDNPKATDTSGDSKWTEQTYLDEWNYCQNGNPKTQGDINANKEGNCEILIRKSYENYNQLKDKRFLDLAKQVLAYSMQSLPKEYLDNLIQNLKYSKIELK